MKTLLILPLLAALSAPAFASEPSHAPDIPPDADSSMYLALGGGTLLAQASDGLDFIVSLGERNLRWLGHINAHRPEGEKLSFTSKETQRGIPIDKPSEYNPTLILKRHAELAPRIPLVMQQVLFGGAAFTDEPPLQVAEYLAVSRELDRIFQSALRWRTMAPWMSYLEGRRRHDLRGWWFLSRLDDRAAKLKRVKALEVPLRSLVRGWLVGLCFNGSASESLAACERAVDGMIESGIDLEAYFQAMAPEAERIFQAYFSIPAYAPRPEVRWVVGASPRVVAPFRDPGSPEVRAFLKDNIEDEWRLGGWSLELPFTGGPDAPYVVFLPGVTPNVNGLGGDRITMNASQPLTEYDAQWTIRHEFGHVLGFPDCYVEFYERERGVIVNYQYDMDNLMCSRRGRIKPTHLSEMKRVYYGL